jgi:hypothetical protein
MDRASGLGREESAPEADFVAGRRSPREDGPQDGLQAELRGRRRRPRAGSAGFFDMSDYVERQPFGALMAAAMTGYAIAWYLRGGKSR